MNRLLFSLQAPSIFYGRVTFDPATIFYNTKVFPVVPR